MAQQVGLQRLTWAAASSAEEVLAQPGQWRTATLASRSCGSIQNDLPRDLDAFSAALQVAALASTQLRWSSQMMRRCQSLWQSPSRLLLARLEEKARGSISFLLEVLRGA